MQPRGRQEGGEEQGRRRPVGAETRNEGREAAEGAADGGRAVQNDYAVKSVWALLRQVVSGQSKPSSPTPRPLTSGLETRTNLECFDTT